LADPGPCPAPGSAKAAVSFLTGLGTGGGSLLLLWLTLVLGMDPALARTVNLMFFIPAAVIASVIRFFKGGIPINNAEK
jgi:uncharacterized membrane protein YfcA